MPDPTRPLRRRPKPRTAETHSDDTVEATEVDPLVQPAVGYICASIVAEREAALQAQRDAIRQGCQERELGELIDIREEARASLEDPHRPSAAHLGHT